MKSVERHLGRFCDLEHGHNSSVTKFARGSPVIDHRLGFGLLFFAGGLLGVAGGIEQRRKKQQLLRRAVRVKARVVSVRTESSNDDGGIDFHYPTIEFRVGGKAVRTEVIVGRSRGEEVMAGYEMTAYYDPLAPSRAVLAPGDWPGGGCVTLLGFASALLGGMLLWDALFQK